MQSTGLIQWNDSVINDPIEPAAADMALGQKAPHFVMYDSGHGSNFNYFISQ